MTSGWWIHLSSGVRRQAGGLIVGTLLTLAAVGVYLAGLTRAAEWYAFDFHVRHFSRLPASPRIVHIDIDDQALERVGSWPWPRDVQAELIRILHQLGAEQVVLDIVWSDPRPPEIRLPGLEPFSDFDAPTTLVRGLTAEDLIHPDDELATAIAEAGNVHLAMYYESAAEPETEPGDLERKILEALRADFELEVPELARRFAVAPERIERNFATLKRRAAEERVDAVLSTRPAADIAEVHTAILSTPPERPTADRADVRAAYHRALGQRALRQRCLPVPPGLAGRIPEVARVVPPVYKFTAESRAVGFVTFRPDLDGRTRHVPLLVAWNGLLLEHLAFSAARDALSIEIDDLSIDERGRLRIAARGDRPAMLVQLDRHGQMLIDWHVDGRGWPYCFEHRPATLLLRLYDARRRIRENQALRESRLDRAVELVLGAEGFASYQERIERLIELRAQVRRARQAGRGGEPAVRAMEAEAEGLRRGIERDRQDVIDLVAEEWAGLRDRPVPEDPREAAEYGRFRQAARLIEVEAAEILAVNERIEAEYGRLLEQLRPMIEGRIAVIGYTATAVADMVNTPPYERVPGVLVHTQVLNNFLQGRFRTWASPRLVASVLAVGGLIATLVTSFQGPRASLLLLGLLLTLGFGINGEIIFGRMHHWVPPLTITVFVPVIWAAIVLVRYLTTEREKRRFSRAVAQYVSPAMARQIAQSGVQLNLSPVEREVTCFFSDLADFTPMSERLGPEGTKAVLNPYLQAMSEVLHRHQALINKFMGDGIFAFFNPPILACPGHEVAACEAALDCQAGLRDLCRQWEHDPLAAEFERLVMRIGIATGTVFVGDFGSENKLDYTCMGDTVNLAARLESANKYFGTRIMLAGPTRQAAGDRYLYRSLGSLRVRGQSLPMPVFELLGRRGEVPGEAVDYAGIFGEAVAAFSQRDWNAAETAFLRCRMLRPADPGPDLYLQAIHEHRVRPPGDDWRGSLELRYK